MIDWDKPMGPLGFRLFSGVLVILGIMVVIGLIASIGVVLT